MSLAVCLKVSVLSQAGKYSVYTETETGGSKTGHYGQLETRFSGRRQGLRH
jgi:hypothetical protein